MPAFWTLVFVGCLLEVACSDDYFMIEKSDIHHFKTYKPTWADLDTRPLPPWYDDAKVGIFIHWGVYSVPSFGSEWFWKSWKAPNEAYVDFMTKNYPPRQTYQDFAHDFTAEFFDPDQWAHLIKQSGARYVVLTSKHHEGFAMWPSSHSFSWNAMDLGPKRDLVGDLAKAVRAEGVKFGLYHSLYEWFNPLYLKDKKSNFESNEFVTSKLWPDMKELVTEYEPDILWTDGDWEANDTYWKSTEFIAWLYNESPNKDRIVINDRWGIGIPCHHGDFYTCTDRFNPGVLQQHKWENCMTIDKESWGFRRNALVTDYLTIDELLYEIVSTVSCGGNINLNVGPTKEGTISPIFQERLLQIGAWLKINGESIYSTSPWIKQNDTFNGDVWYTCKKAEYNAMNPISRPVKPVESVERIYAISLGWPSGNILVLADIASYLKANTSIVTMLGNEEEALAWEKTNGKVLIDFPDKSTVRSTNAWALKFTI